MYLTNNLTYYKHQMLKMFGNKVLTETFGKLVQVNADSALKIYCSSKQNYGEYVMMDPKLFEADRPTDIEGR